MRRAIIARIAREELRALTRNHVAAIACAILALLIVASVGLGLDRRARIEGLRAHHQAASDAAFKAQPDRHPHRMVHYGQYVFRPLSALAFFDPGVDAYTGSMAFLEGHRQNSANFSEARQSSLLMRFGDLSPAFVLQVLAPLLMVFLAHGAIARERESGLLRVLLAQGLRPAEILVGKLATHLGLSLTLLAPAALALAALVAAGQAPAGPAGALLLVYALYLAFWATLAVLVSSLFRRGRDALAALVSIWMALTIILPRGLPELAALLHPQPTRIETDVAIHRDLKAIGDSHNPDDPYFAAYKARILRQYGVSRVEDLPVQWAGLVSYEGERLTSALFDRYAAEAFARESAQNRLVRAFSVVSPMLAVRTGSSALAATDVESHKDFLDQVEAHRFAFVQALNRVQIETIPNQNAGPDPRVSADTWARMPTLVYHAPDPLARSAGAISATLAILLAWLAALGFALRQIARRPLESFQ